MTEANATADILGQSPEIRALRQQIQTLAHYPEVPVLILGETGTGKDLVAAAIHAASAPGGPYVPVNMAAVAPSVFETELFGHEAGAYTGAQAARLGLLESAQGGTVYLDEIGEVPVDLQSKLLRVLETRCVRPVGSNEDRRLNVRVVSATNQAVSGAGGALRPDLFHRLAGFLVTLPPLRSRRDDVTPIACALLERFCERHRLPHMTLSCEALCELSQQPWPGNVRELKTVVERAAMLATGGTIAAQTVRAALVGTPPQSERLTPTPLPGGAEDAPGGRTAGRLREAERQMIQLAYEYHRGNLSKTAEQLGIARSTLRNRLRRYDISRLP